MAQLNKNPELSDAIARRDDSEETGLLRNLSFSPITTLTGRIRGRVSFTAARNTPFQGLAADGAKLALYELVKAGYKVVAFIHDEFVIELSDDADWATEPQNIDKIICDAVSSVCIGFPIACEGARSKRWYKGAKPVRDEATGGLLCWEPKPEKKTEPKPAIVENGPRLKPKPAPETPSNEQNPVESTRDTSRIKSQSTVSLVHDDPRIFCGTCIEVGQHLHDAGERFDLVFGDPSLQHWPWVCGT